MTNVAWLEALSPWPEDGFGWTDARAAHGARPAPGGAAGGPRRGDERQVDDDADGRGAPALPRGVDRRVLSPHVRSWSERIRVAGADVDLEPLLEWCDPRPSASGRRSSRCSRRPRSSPSARPRSRRGWSRRGSADGHDATNVLDATRVVVLTNVSLEHTDVLGLDPGSDRRREARRDPHRLCRGHRGAGVGGRRVQGRGRWRSSTAARSSSRGRPHARSSAATSTPACSTGSSSRAARAARGGDPRRSPQSGGRPVARRASPRGRLHGDGVDPRGQGRGRDARAALDGGSALRRVPLVEPPCAGSRRAAAQARPFFDVVEARDDPGQALASPTRSESRCS